MRHTANTDRARIRVVDYSAARAKAIEWLGDRYLLAKPINRSPLGDYRQRAQRPSSRSTDCDQSARPLPQPAVR